MKKESCNCHYNEEELQRYVLARADKKFNQMVREDKIKRVCLTGAIVIAFISVILLVVAHAQPCPALTASWYSVKSCLREGTSGIMANGRRLQDDKETCASWDYKFGTVLKITNLANQKSVLAVVTDRGPAKRLYRKGRVVDLSVGAFKKIASLKQGIIEVKIEVVR